VEWSEIRLTVPPEALEVTALVLHEHGTGGVVVESETEARLCAYLPADARLSERLAAIRAALDDLQVHFPGLAGRREEVGRVRDEDWANAWRAHFRPSRIGRRLVVAPSWEDYRRRRGEVVLRLDPGMAFGTGTHASSILCLLALERAALQGCRVLDVGTGSGILAIAAALLGAARVTALDVDPVAVRTAAANAAENGVTGSVAVLEGDLRGIEPALTGAGAVPADAVVANLTADVILGLAPVLARCVAPGGWLVVSGLIATEAGRVAEALASAGLRPAATEGLDGWAAVRLVRPGA
jgi:ribosomal protein L11 methyltransferase